MEERLDSTSSGSLDSDKGGTNNNLSQSGVEELFCWDGERFIAIPELRWDRTIKALKVQDRIVNRTNSVVTETTEVTNTTNEEVIYRGDIAADVLRTGNWLHSCIAGLVTNASASDDFTLRVYMGATLLLTMHPAIGQVTDASWSVRLELTVRSVDVSGEVIACVDARITDYVEHQVQIVSMDTTVSEDLTVTVQWDNQETANSIRSLHGGLEFKH